MDGAGVEAGASDALNRRLHERARPWPGFGYSTTNPASLEETVNRAGIAWERHRTNHKFSPIARRND